MHRHEYKDTRNMKNQGHMIYSKENNNFLVTDPKEMEIYQLPDKKFITGTTEKTLKEIYLKGRSILNWLF